MAIELESTGIKVSACSPDFIKTNLNNYEGTGTVEEGALESLCGLRCSGRMARLERSRAGRARRFRGEEAVRI